MSNSFKAIDASITSLTGASQTALAANGARQYLEIQNTGSSNVGVNICGGTAAIGGTGTLTLAAGASRVWDVKIPAGDINVIGTSGQPLAVIWG